MRYLSRGTRRKSRATTVWERIKAIGAAEGERATTGAGRSSGSRIGGAAEEWENKAEGGKWEKSPKPII